MWGGYILEQTRAGSLLDAAGAMQQRLPADGRVVIGSGTARIPLLNFGTGNVTQWLLDGGRGIDTTSERNHKESSVSQTMKTLPRLGLSRSDIFITSKVMCLPSVFSPGHLGKPANNQTNDALNDIRSSGVGYLDLLLLWFPCSSFGATVAAYRRLEPLVANGLVHALGVSNFNASALEALVARVTVKPAINQCGMSIAGHRNSAWGSNAATVRRSRELGIVYSAYSPVGGVTHVQSNIMSSSIVNEIADQHKVTPAQIAVLWLVQQGIPVVTSTKSTAHMRDALRVLDLKLDAGEMTRLADIPDACDEREGNNHCKKAASTATAPVRASADLGSLEAPARNVAAARLQLDCDVASVPVSVRNAQLELKRLWNQSVSEWPFGAVKLKGRREETVDISSTCLVFDGPWAALGTRGVLAHYPCMCSEGASEPAKAGLRHWVGLFVSHHSSETEVVAHHRWVQLEVNRSLFAPVRRNRCGEAERDLLQSMEHGLTTYKVAHAASDEHVWQLATMFCNATHLSSGGFSEVVFWECAHGVGHGVYHYVATTSILKPTWPPHGGFRACRPPRPHSLWLTETDIRRMDRVCAMAPSRELALRCAEGGYHSYFKGLPVGWRAQEHVCSQDDLYIAAGCYLHFFTPEGTANESATDFCIGPSLAAYGESNRIGCIFGAAGAVMPYRDERFDSVKCRAFGKPSPWDGATAPELLRRRELACTAGLAFKARQLRGWQVCDEATMQRCSTHTWLPSCGGCLPLSERYEKIDSVMGRRALQY